MTWKAKVKSMLPLQVKDHLNKIGWRKVYNTLSDLELQGYTPKAAKNYLLTHQTWI